MNGRLTFKAICCFILRKTSFLRRGDLRYRCRTLIPFLPADPTAQVLALFASSLVVWRPYRDLLPITLPLPRAVGCPKTATCHCTFLFTKVVAFLWGGCM